LPEPDMPVIKTSSKGRALSIGGWVLVPWLMLERVEVFFVGAAKPFRRF
jgi:hypothetical protein